MGATTESPGAKAFGAVVSLPAGVFNPYSGVKTSILIFDKSLAKKTNTIAFFKIDNDGFGLGAQRREIGKNDLPQAQAEIGEYLRRLRAGESMVDFLPALGLIVEKAKIAANGEYNLSVERYRDNGARTSEYPHVELGEVCKINPDSVSPAELYPGSFFNYIDISSVENESGRFLGPSRLPVDDAPSRVRRSVSQDDVLISTVRPNLKAFAILTEVPEHAVASTGFAVLRANSDRLLPAFLNSMLRHKKSVDQMVGMMGRGAYPSINQADVASVQISLPPLEVQKEIVAAIEGYQKVIDGTRAVLDNYRPHIPIHRDWPIVLLGDHFATTSGGTPSKAVPRFWTGQIPWVSPKDMKFDLIEDTEDHISEAAIEASATKLIPGGSVVCVVRSGILKHSFPVALLARGMCINQDLIAFRPTSSAISSKFLFYVLKTKAASILEDGIKSGVTVQSFYNGFFRDYPIPLPVPATQQEIVSEIEAEQALVAPTTR